MVNFRSDIVSLYGVANSMKGGRPENQDDFDFRDTPLGFLCIVCDGMGGGPGGKTASYLAKYEISTAICQCISTTPKENALKMAIAKANEAIETKMQEVPALNGMGTTVVAILINQESAVVAHAGDSRCYQIRNKKCIYRSHDHSLVAQLVEKKVLTEEEARISPQANVITRGLGCTSNHVPEIDVLSYKKDDRFIICTDGIWGSMPQKELLQLFSQKTDIHNLVTNLSQEVDQIGNSKGGGHDNHTIAMIEMDSDSLRKSTHGKKRMIYISLLCLLATVALIVLLIVLTRKHAQDTSKTMTANKPLVGYSSEPQTKDYPSHHEKTSIESLKIDSIDLKEAIDRYLYSLGISKSSDSSVISQKDTKANSVTITNMNDAKAVAQQAIEKYKGAIEVAEPDVKDAQAKVEEFRKQEIELLQRLHSLTNEDVLQNKVDAIMRIANYEKYWYVDKTPDANNNYKLTQKNIENAEKQIERLDSIKGHF